MKSCIICTSSSDDAAATCPNCGEASWSVPSEIVVPADPLTVTDAASASIVPSKGKRSKKQ